MYVFCLSVKQEELGKRRARPGSCNKTLENQFVLLSNWGNWWQLSSCIPWSMFQQQQKWAGRETEAEGTQQNFVSFCVFDRGRLCASLVAAQERQQNFELAGDNKNQT